MCRLNFINWQYKDNFSSNASTPPQYTLKLSLGELTLSTKFEQINFPQETNLNHIEAHLGLKPNFLSDTKQKILDEYDAKVN